MTSSRPSSAGLTATELIVVTAIFALLSTMVYATVLYQTQTYRTQTSQVASQTKLRYWMAEMVKDIRRAGFDPHDDDTLDFGITVADATEIQFTTDVDGDGTLDAGETFGYKLDGDALSVLRGSGWRPVVTGVGGFQLVYRDPRGNVTTRRSLISSVDIALTAEASTASFEGKAAATHHSPSIVVGSGETTVDATGGSTPVLARIERARIRNFR